MKTFIDIPTGVVTIVPQSTGDRMLLFHLLNCSDMTKFSEYLQTKDGKTEMTSELGAEFNQFTGYMEASGIDNTEEIDLPSRLIGFSR